MENQHEDFFIQKSIKNDDFRLFETFKNMETKKSQNKQDKIEKS